MAGGYELGGDARVVHGGAPMAHNGGAAPVVQNGGPAPEAQNGVAPVAHGDGAPAQDGIAAFDDAGGAFDAETIELIAQIRQLAAEDPNGVQQVVAEVLAALDRVTGVTVRDP